LKTSKQLFLLIVTVLIVCAIPLLLFSEQRQQFLGEVVSTEWAESHPWLAAGLVIGMFASDILLPVPSSAVCATAGHLFGLGIGTMLCWIGLNISALVGYWMGRVLGWAAIDRFSDREETDLVGKQIDRWGVWPIVAFRPLPVLAEASILLLGVYRFPQSKFWPPIIFTNFVVAATFVAIGTWFSEQDNFAIGLLLSCALPTIGLLIWVGVTSRRIRKNDQP